MPPFQALLIDLDDTILRAEVEPDDGWTAVCVQHAERSGRFDPDTLFRSISRFRDWYWSDPERHRVGRASLIDASARIVELALAECGMEDPDLARSIATDYRTLRDGALSLIPGALSTVEHFRGEGVRTALVTNGAGPVQRRKVRDFALEGYFEVVWIEGERGIGKPEPGVYTGVLEALGVPASAAWSVGDNLEWDVLAPQRAGITGVWIDIAGGSLPDSAGDRPGAIIRSLAELPAIVPRS